MDRYSSEAEECTDFSLRIKKTPFAHVCVCVCVCVCVYVCVCVCVCVHYKYVDLKKKAHLRVFCAEFAKPAKEMATTGYRGLTGCITILRTEIKCWRRGKMSNKNNLIQHGLVHHEHIDLPYQYFTR